MKTRLTISGVGFPTLSYHSCTQILELIPFENLKRTINGELIYFGNSEFEKYKTTLQGQGEFPPGFDHLCRGMILKIGCIQRLWQETKASTILLNRDPIESSILVVDEKGHKGTLETVRGRQLTLKNNQTNLYVSYCPILKMRVTDLKVQQKEWEKDYNWTLELHEI